MNKKLVIGIILAIVLIAVAIGAVVMVVPKQKTLITVYTNYIKNKECLMKK